MQNSFYRAAKQRIFSFRKENQGTATVDAVLWMPVFIVMFAFLADTALVFGGQAQVLRIVQDANRAMSVGRLRTELEVQDAVLLRVANLSPHATVLTVVDGTGVIRTDVVLPLADLTATGLVRAFTDLNVTVSAQHMMEN